MSNVNGANGKGANGTGVLERTKEEATAFREDFAEIGRDLQDLARKEVQLLRAEVMEQVMLAGRAAAFAGGAAVIGLVVAIFVFISLMFVLDEFLPTSVAALVTTLVASATAAALAYFARETFRNISVTPKRTINSLKEDAEWARSLLQSNKR